MDQPILSYTIWHTQRTGSTWLCDGLAATGFAGRPEEALYVSDPSDLLQHYGVGNSAELIAAVQRLGSTANGIFGIKQGYSEPYFSKLLTVLGHPHVGGPPTRLAIWERAFPNHRHIFMTRRNKIRLAVSWWRAIQSGEWHRRHDQQPSAGDMSNKYSFDAIDRLLNEAVFREAGLQELFAEAGIVPLTVTYEDLLLEPLPTFHRVLAFLQVERAERMSFTSHLTRTSDAGSEEWVQRFRREKQMKWPNLGW